MRGEQLQSVLVKQVKQVKHERIVLVKQVKQERIAGRAAAATRYRYYLRQYLYLCTRKARTFVG